MSLRALAYEEIVHEPCCKTGKLRVKKRFRLHAIEEFAAQQLVVLPILTSPTPLSSANLHHTFCMVCSIMRCCFIKSVSLFLMLACFSLFCFFVLLFYLLICWFFFRLLFERNNRSSLCSWFVCLSLCSCVKKGVYLIAVNISRSACFRCCQVICFYFSHMNFPQKCNNNCKFIFIPHVVVKLNIPSVFPLLQYFRKLS